jgi:hypothetical protein
LAKSADLKFAEIDELIAEGMNVLAIELNWIELNLLSFPFAGG